MDGDVGVLGAAERLDDLAPLAEHFLARHGRAEHKRGCRLSPDALRLLEAHRWPGNARELENEIQRALVLAAPGESLAPAAADQTKLGSSVLWKSVDTGTIGDITDEDGWGPDLTDTTYRWYNDDYDWEWAMVYEERLPLSFCQGTPWAVTVYSAHNSPPKDGEPDVPIAVYDWGDAPEGIPINTAAGTV